MVRKERDHRVGVIVDVEHPGDNRWLRRRRGINNNPVAQKRAAARAAREAEEAKAKAEAEAAE